MPWNRRIAEEAAGIAASRTRSSPTLLIHAAIPLRMSSANPHTPLQRIPEPIASSRKASYRSAST
jgi:hypothetical protein